MNEKVFLVHGWSVTETTTYQALHLKLRDEGFDLAEIYLGRYVTLDNEVEVQDIAKAMHKALVEHLGRPPWRTPFHVITHSTGALILKEWVVRRYTGSYAKHQALRNLVFLAGPHFGSRLAHHGRSMLARAAYWGDTGKNVLIALELGSAFSWRSNGEWLDRGHWEAKGIRPYGLIGDMVERDFFKSKIFPAGYEEGSDMVVP
jgi:triacylglycerol esterase/lipase EstA (alpha/beta hydrolase family)